PLVRGAAAEARLADLGRELRHASRDPASREPVGRRAGAHPRSGREQPRRVTVERVTEADDELLAAVARLLPQLSPDREPPGLPELSELVAAPGTHLFVARDGPAILGMLTLLLYRVPTGIRGWIHDVVVDESARGRGVGE